MRFMWMRGRISPLNHSHGFETLVAAQGASEIPLLQVVGAGGGGAGKKKRAPKSERDPNKPK